MNISPKIQAAGAAGALTVVLVWGLGFLDVSVPPGVASAITVLISTAAGWLKSETSPPARLASERGATEPLTLLVYVLVIVILLILVVWLARELL